MNFKDQLGVVTFAQNSTIDYLELAYLQALSIKITMPKLKYAVITDEQSLKDFKDKYWQAIDYVVPLTEDYAKNDTQKFANEWQVFHLTPFRETIKVESDIIFTRDISHWVTAFRLRDIVLSTGTKTYKQTNADSRAYRQLFDINQLPDVYNGLMYFNYTLTASNFFKTAKTIFLNWEEIQTNLKRCVNVPASTDLVYALAAKLVGIEKCTLPLDWVNFVHMKPAINNWPEGKWFDSVITELDIPMLRIGNLNQYQPVHYYEKTWITNEIIKGYENELLGRINQSF